MLKRCYNNEGWSKRMGKHNEKGILFRLPSNKIWAEKLLFSHPSGNASLKELLGLSDDEDCWRDPDEESYVLKC